MDYWDYEYLSYSYHYYLFIEKDGKTETRFSGWMGHNILALRPLKLNPVDAYLARKNKFHGGQFS